MLGKMYAKWNMWKKNFEFLKSHGVSRNELKAKNDDQDPEGGKDSIIVAIGRREAQEKAKQILASVKSEGGRPVTDDEVLACLQLWGFKENTNRGNVMPDGHKFVHSDAIGLIKMSTCERTLLTVGSKRYPEFTQLITRWLRDRMPAQFKDQEFTYTSVNINKNYGGKLHRDGNNAGPSIIQAFGKFTGGQLNYWPSDDKKQPLEDFTDKAKVTVNIKDNLLLFDGNRGHCVSGFKGERYTLVFFSIRTWNKAPKSDAEEAKRCGIPLPTKKSMDYANSLIGKSGKAGYHVWPSVHQGKKDAKRSMTSAPKDDIAAKRRRVATPCRSSRS